MRPLCSMTAASMAFVVFASTATPVRAADPPALGTEAERAQELKKQGDLAMDSLRYEEAIERYTRAYELSKDPAVLYNRGRVYQARSQYPEALDDFQEFERQAPPELKARVPRLAELIADVRARVATLTLLCDVKGARVVVRNKIVGTTPLPPLKLSAGPAMVEVTAEGYTPFAVEQPLPGGGESTLQVNLRVANRVGVLAILTDAPARVFIDGTEVGDAPVEVTRGAGTHKIVLRRPSFDDFETSAVVAAGQRRQISFDLPKKPPITSKWWFWTGAGVVVAAGAATIYALTSERKAASGDHFEPSQIRTP